MKQIFGTTLPALVGGLVLALGLASVTMAAVNRKDLKPPAEGHIQILQLTDGSSLNGQIVEVRSDEVVFQSSVGKSTIAIDRIRSIREVKQSDIRSGQYWFPNPNRTRLYVGPTARMLKKGEGYFSDVYLFFPGVAYGITKNISIGGGMSIFPGLAVNEQIFYFTPKVGLEAAGKLNVAASALITVIPDWSDDAFDQPKTVGIVFGVATYGDDDNSVTLGLGYGYANKDFADKPAVIVGGEWRLMRRMSFVTENWVLPGVDPPLISYGLRFFGEGIGVDLALLNVGSADAIFPGIPFIDFVYNF